MLQHHPGDVVVVRGKPYQLLELMARGGQGAVFGAKDADGRSFAIKLVQSNPRHKNEVRILAAVRSDHVVRLFDAGESRDTLILVLERVEGVDLKELVLLCQEEGRSIVPGLAIELVRQACLGLRDASDNARLIFHRDIKPANLILSRTGVVKLLDFGIAHRDDSLYTGSLIGTPENMAPEQVGLDRHLKIDIRTDLYCLGLVLFELLTLETVFHFGRQMPIPERLMMVHRAEVHERLRRVRAIHPALTAFLRRSLQRLPDERFQSPMEMLEAMARLQEHLPLTQPMAAYGDAIYLAAVSDERSSAYQELLPVGRHLPTISMDLHENSPSALPETHRSHSVLWMVAIGLGTIALTVVLVTILFRVFAGTPA